MSQFDVIKQIINAIACTIELWMYLGGLLSTQEARVARGDLLRFFRAQQRLACIHNSIVHAISVYHLFIT